MCDSKPELYVLEKTVAPRISQATEVQMKMNVIAMMRLVIRDSFKFPPLVLFLMFIVGRKLLSGNVVSHRRWARQLHLTVLSCVWPAALDQTLAFN